MSFDEWWTNVGQRTQAFCARSFALAGWNGHKLHSGDVTDDGILPHVDCYLCGRRTDEQGFCEVCKIYTRLDSHPLVVKLLENQKKTNDDIL